MGDICKTNCNKLQAGIAAVLIALSAAAACTYAQSSPQSAAAREADAELLARVRSALHADPNFYDGHVDVTIEKGNVVLTGLVQNNRELLYALQIATKAAGGRKVIDALTIIKDSAR